MKKPFIRFVALLLIPALLIDPGFGAALHNFRPSRTRFSQEALITSPLSAHVSFLKSLPRFGSLLIQYLQKSRRTTVALGVLAFQGIGQAAQWTGDKIKVTPGTTWGELLVHEKVHHLWRDGGAFAQRAWDVFATDASRPLFALRAGETISRQRLDEAIQTALQPVQTLSPAWPRPQGAGQAPVVHMVTQNSALLDALHFVTTHPWPLLAGLLAIGVAVSAYLYRKWKPIHAADSQGVAKPRFWTLRRALAIGVLATVSLAPMIGMRQAFVPKAQPLVSGKVVQATPHARASRVQSVPSRAPLIRQGPEPKPKESRHDGLLKILGVALMAVWGGWGFMSMIRQQKRGHTATVEKNPLTEFPAVPLEPEHVSLPAPDVRVENYQNGVSDTAREAAYIKLKVLIEDIRESRGGRLTSVKELQNTFAQLLQEYPWVVSDLEGRALIEQIRDQLAAMKGAKATTKNHSTKPANPVRSEAALKSFRTKIEQALKPGSAFKDLPTEMQERQLRIWVEELPSVAGVTHLSDLQSEDGLYVPVARIHNLLMRERAKLREDMAQASDHPRAPKSIHLQTPSEARVLDALSQQFGLSVSGDKDRLAHAMWQHLLGVESESLSGPSPSGIRPEELERIHAWGALRSNGFLKYRALWMTWNRVARAEPLAREGELRTYLKNYFDVISQLARQHRLRGVDRALLERDIRNLERRRIKIVSARDSAQIERILKNIHDTVESAYDGSHDRQPEATPFADDEETETSRAFGVDAFVRINFQSVTPAEFLQACQMLNQQIDDEGVAALSESQRQTWIERGQELIHVANQRERFRLTSLSPDISEELTRIEKTLKVLTQSDRNDIGPRSGDGSMGGANGQEREVGAFAAAFSRWTRPLLRSRGQVNAWLLIASIPLALWQRWLGGLSQSAVGPEFTASGLGIFSWSHWPPPVQAIGWFMAYLALDWLGQANLFERMGRRSFDRQAIFWPFVRGLAMLTALGLCMSVGGTWADSVHGYALTGANLPSHIWSIRALNYLTFVPMIAFVSFRTLPYVLEVSRILWSVRARPEAWRRKNPAGAYAKRGSIDFYVAQIWSPGSTEAAVFSALHELRQLDPHGANAFEAFESTYLNTSRSARVRAEALVGAILMDRPAVMASLSTQWHAAMASGNDFHPLALGVAAMDQFSAKRAVKLLKDLGDFDGLFSLHIVSTDELETHGADVLKKSLGSRLPGISLLQFKQAARTTETGSAPYIVFDSRHGTRGLRLAAELNYPSFDSAFARTPATLQDPLLRSPENLLAILLGWTLIGQSKQPPVPMTAPVAPFGRKVYPSALRAAA